jgi:hypothetical protein
LIGREREREQSSRYIVQKGKKIKAVYSIKRKENRTKHSLYGFKRKKTEQISIEQKGKHRANQSLYSYKNEKNRHSAKQLPIRLHRHQNHTGYPNRVTLQP